MRRLLSLFLGIIAILPVSAQIEVADSLSLAPPAATVDSLSLSGDDFVPEAGSQSVTLPPLPWAGPMAVPFVVRLELDRYLSTLASPGVMARWDGGSFAGALSRQWLPGLMSTETGRLILSQTLGPVTIEGYASASHYASMFGLTRTLGFGGSFTYRFTDRLSLTLYGAYHTRPAFATPAMMGYIDVPSFGGYLDWRAGEHWGMQVGAGSYRSMLDNHWHVSPSVVLYYRTSSGAKFGVDVGSIIYNLIMDAADDKGRRWGPQNPTVAPPKLGMLPVGPAPPPPPTSR